LLTFLVSNAFGASGGFIVRAGVESDIEFGLGQDDSELYGDVAFFSLYLYFYGAD